MPKHKIINALSCKGLRGIGWPRGGTESDLISGRRMSSRLSGSRFPASTIDTMVSAWFLGEIAQPVPVPRLLVELPPWPRSVLRQSARSCSPPAACHRSNFASPRRLSGLTCSSSAVFHGKIPPIRRLSRDRIPLLIGFTRFFALEPQVVAKPPSTTLRWSITSPRNILPPLDTRSPAEAQPGKADPEFPGSPSFLFLRSGQSLPDHRHTT